MSIKNKRNEKKPKNPLKGGLIGLEVHVIGSSNKSQIGLRGKIIDETKNTVVIEKSSSRKRLLKKNIMLKYPKTAGN